MTEATRINMRTPTRAERLANSIALADKMGKDLSSPEAAGFFKAWYAVTALRRNVPIPSEPPPSTLCGPDSPLGMRWMAASISISAEAS